MRLTMTCLLLILTSFITTACADRPHVKIITIDPVLTSCQDEPAVPPRPVTNRQDAQYKNDLRLAGADCRSKLNRVREINEQAIK